MLPNFVTFMKNHHLVKRILKDQESDDEDDFGGGSIFDNFGGPAMKTEEKKESKEKVEINVDYGIMISQISDIYCNKGFAALSLILAQENKEEKFTQSSARRFVRNLLTEIIKASHNPGSNSL